MIQNEFDLKYDDTAKLIMILLGQMGSPFTYEFYSRVCRHQNGVHSSSEKWIKIDLNARGDQDQEGA
jgi:hypothetical protein